jgi:tRNA A-37 threonylcarbamoyl transferase component Bud32
MTELIDTRLGQYQLTEIIGQGGMAVVYKAFQPSLERFVAIKLLLHNHDPQFAERFKLEARTIANLQHPNILPIYDYGEQAGMLYLVLQYIENSASLADALGAQMEPAPALRLLARVLDALGYAHERGIIHRDIKPSNILLLSPRWPMLADFGIAKLMSDDQRLTMSGMIVGTAAYMAPEQATGRTVDARTDLYAAGIVLYELLTGRVPFDADTPVAVLIKQSYESPPPPRSLNPALPEAVEAALLRALAKDPADRYQTAAEMVEALERIAAEIERAPARDQRPDLYQTGVQAFQAGRWEAAIAQFERVVALDPAYEDAARRLDEARKQQATAEQQDLRASFYQTGVQAFQAGRWEAAIAQFERLVALDPAYEDAPRWLDNARKAQAYSQQQAARRDADELAQHVPEPAPAETRAPRAPTGRSVRAGWPLWVGALIVLALLGAGAIWLARGPGGAQPAPTAAPTVAIVAAATPLPSPAPTTLVAAGATAAPAISPAPVNTPVAAPSPTAAAAPSPAPLPTAVVDAARVNVRGGPGENFPSLGLYERGAVFYIIGKTQAGDWLQVLTLDEQVGWVLAANLKIDIDLATVPIAEAPTPAP